MYIAYTLIHLLISALFVAGTFFIDIESNSFGLIATGASAIYPGQIFVLHQHRAMTRRERLGFSAIASLLSILVALIIIGATLFLAGVPLTIQTLILVLGATGANFSPPVWAGILGFGYMLGVVAIYFFVSILTKTTLKTLDSGKTI